VGSGVVTVVRCPGRLRSEPAGRCLWKGPDEITHLDEAIGAGRPGAALSVRFSGSLLGSGQMTCPAQSVRAYSPACLSAAALLHQSDDESSPCFTDLALLTHRRDAKPCVELVSFCI